jgi:plastocyanin
MKRMSGWLSAAVLAGGLAICLSGCKKSNETPAASEGGSSPAATATRAASIPLDPATLGSVTGTVSFKGKAPERLKIDMSQDPVCSMTGGDNYAEQYVVHDGKLANVYIYVKSGPAAAMSAGPVNTKPVVLDQKGCKYVPHVIAMMQGEPVKFENSDATMHNIHTTPAINAPVDVSQGPNGAAEMKTFGKPEVMMPVRCNNHPWMNAFINVSATPFFAVTDADGHFEIKGLPAGTYTLAAVHEKLGEQTMTVTVAPQKTGKADFSYSMK